MPGSYCFSDSGEGWIAYALAWCLLKLNWKYVSYLLGEAYFENMEWTFLTWEMPGCLNED
jgi:hypothetical protein